MTCKSDDKMFVVLLILISRTIILDKRNLNHQSNQISIHWIHTPAITGMWPVLQLLTGICNQDPDETVTDSYFPLLGKCGNRQTIAKFEDRGAFNALPIQCSCRPVRIQIQVSNCVRPSPSTPFFKFQWPGHFNEADAIC